MILIICYIFNTKVVCQFVQHNSKQAMITLQEMAVFNSIIKHLWHNMSNHQKLLKAKVGPSPMNIYNKLKLGTEQLAKLLKKTKAK